MNFLLFDDNDDGDDNDDDDDDDDGDDDEVVRIIYDDVIAINKVMTVINTRLLWDDLLLSPRVSRNLQPYQ